MKVNKKITAWLIVIAFNVVLMGLFLLLARIAPYSLTTLGAIVALSVAVILIRRWGRFSAYSFFLIIAGILFIASASVDFFYTEVIRSLPVIEQIEFSRIMRLNSIRSGLRQVGMGILFIEVFFWFYGALALTGRKNIIALSLLLFGVGIYWIVWGIQSVINGFTPL